MKKERLEYIPVPLKFKKSVDIAKTMRGFSTRADYLNFLADEINPMKNEKEKPRKNKRSGFFDFPDNDF